MGNGDGLGDGTFGKVTWRVTNKGAGFGLGLGDSVWRCGEGCGKVDKGWGFVGEIWVGAFWWGKGVRFGAILGGNLGLLFCSQCLKRLPDSSEGILGLTYGFFSPHYPKKFIFFTVVI